jgi:hypothetical protein
MTGDVTQVILDVLDVLSPRCAADVKATARARIAKMLPAIVAFGIGAIAGALAYRNFGFWALLLPFAGLIWLTTSAWIHRDAVGKLLDAADQKLSSNCEIQFPISSNSVIALMLERLFMRNDVCLFIVSFESCNHQLSLFNLLPDATF